MIQSKSLTISPLGYRVLLKRLSFVFLSLLIVACAGKEAPPEVSYDGMVLIKHSRSGALYQKANLNLKQYDQFILLPSEVSFKKNWKEDYNRNNITGRVKDQDMERIKRDLASLFDEVFTEELKLTKNFSRVFKPGPKTLLLRPALVNLDVNAPDLKTPARSRTYVERAGEGTLYLEVYDSVSGEILVRVIDARETRRTNYYNWANKVTNKADATALLRRWAKQLREKLDEIHEA